MPQDPNQKWPSQTPPLGTGEGEVPLAPPQISNIEMRTMASDIKTSNEAGGGMPRPYTPPPAPTRSESILPQSQPASRPQSPTPPPIVPRKESSPFFQPPMVPTTPTPNISGGAPHKSKKGLLVTIIIIIGIAGVAALGYFVVYPMLFKKAPEVPATTETTPPPAAVTPTPAPETTPPPTTPVATTTATSSATDILTHTSLLKTPADVMADVLLLTTDLSGLQGAFKFETTDVPILKEAVLKNADGKSISFAQFLKIVTPSLALDDTTNLFAPDATYLTYTNSKGTWFAFIANLADSASLDTAKTKISGIEKTSEIVRFFLQDPGTPGTWKSGQTAGVDGNRYLTFSTPGAALDYGWINNKTLVISASYDGFKEILKRLQ